MMADLAENPRSQFLIRNNDYIDLLAQMMAELSTQLSTHFTPQTLARGLGCAAELMNYFQHWNEWKRSHYREDWFYQPLRKIYDDLKGIYSFKIIRGAIALLRELEFLSVKQNERALDGRNGGDRTHRYLLHCNRVAAALAKFKATFSSQSKKSKEAETLDASPFVLCKTPSSTCKTPKFSGEQYTKILSINPSINSNSLLDEQEKLDFVQEEEIEDPWTVGEDELDRELLELFNSRAEIVEKQEVSDEDHFSAPTEPELIKTVEASASPSPEPKCFEVVQPDLKPLPRLKSDRPSGFRSDTERDGFYQVLLELGKTQGKRSPAAWSTKIIKSVDAGEPCQYLTEYRDGQQVGSCEKQEWEIAPGQVFPRFISYLTTKLKKAEMTDEQAIVTAHQQLKDVNLARSLWESCKRCFAKYQEDWEKQKQLGVQNAYLPPELLPEREVSFEQAVGAIASLQSGCTQLQAVEPAELTSAAAELEPVKEQPSDPEPEIISPQWLQQNLDSSPAQASLARTLARKFGYPIEEGLVLPAEGMPSVEHLRSLLPNPITAPKVARLIAAHPDWGFWIDAAGEIQDF
jgi:hypothetical protein